MRLKPFLAALSAAVIVSVSSAMQPDSQDAQIATREGRWKDALVLWEKLGNLHPNDADVVAETGWAELQTGDISSASRSFSRALRLSPDHERALLGRSALAQKQYRFDEGVKWAVQATKAHKNSADAFRALGDAQMAATRRPDAETAYRTAVTLDPSDARNHAALAESLRARGKVADALGSYRMAVKLDSDSAALREGLGRVAMAAGLYGESASAFADAIDRLRRSNPDWKRVDQLTLNLIENLSKAASGFAKGSQTERDLRGANNRTLKLADTLALLPEFQDADPVLNPVVGQRAQAWDLLGQACSAELAGLEGDRDQSADAVVFREQARRAILAAQAGG
ncbi:MAG: tetratricopeptide repeat protein [Armatimonadetes bacterium]|nr:tetratricopeptide repeat protein [Armatimonadota bacterium]